MPIRTTRRSGALSAPDDTPNLPPSWTEPRSAKSAACSRSDGAAALDAAGAACSITGRGSDSRWRFLRMAYGDVRQERRDLHEDGSAVFGPVRSFRTGPVLSCLSSTPAVAVSATDS